MIISKNKIIKRFLSDPRPISLYIDNPFCYKRCKYCVHYGCLESKKKDVDEYYFKYLPNEFKKFNKIINEKEIKMICFGGGTPNYLSAIDFDKFCSTLPKKIIDSKKYIELHVGLLNKNFLDVLKKYNFTGVCFCIQTFDKDELKKQNRIENKYDVVDLIKYAKKLGFFICIDLITYFNKDKDFDLNILNNDLTILESALDCINEITISSEYKNRFEVPIEQYEKFKSSMLNIVFRKLKNFEYIYSTQMTIPYRFINKKNDNYESFKNFYNIYVKTLTDYTWSIECGVSTLAIGGYDIFKERKSTPISSVGANFKYSTSRLWKVFTIYNLFENTDFFKECIKKTKELKKIIKKNNIYSLPVDFELSFKNIIHTKKCDNTVRYFSDINFNDINAKLGVETHVKYNKNDTNKLLLKDIYMEDIWNL